MTKAKKIKIEIRDKYVAFTIHYLDTFDGMEWVQKYHTNEAGEGVWTGDTYNRQITGTCDFQLHQKTRSGIYKAIKRWAER